MYPNHSPAASRALPLYVLQPPQADAKAQPLTSNIRTPCGESYSPQPGVLESIEAAALEGERLLYDRKRAAEQLSISVRSLDYLIAGKKLATRRIGKKVLVPRSELLKFVRSDHPEPVM